MLVHETGREHFASLAIRILESFDSIHQPLAPSKHMHAIGSLGASQFSYVYLLASEILQMLLMTTLANQRISNPRVQNTQIALLTVGDLRWGSTGVKALRRWWPPCLIHGRSG